MVLLTATQQNRVFVIEATTAKPISRAVFIITLVLAGEMIFSLPFHTARFFRPTLLEVSAETEHPRRVSRGRGRATTSEQRISRHR